MAKDISFTVEDWEVIHKSPIDNVPVTNQMVFCIRKSLKQLAL